MNLLPEEEKKEVGQERMRRFLVVALLGCAGVFGIGSILLLPSYFFAEYQQRESERGLQALTSSPEIGRMKEEKKEAEARAATFSKLEALFAESKSVAVPFGLVLAARSEGVKISSLSYSISKDIEKISVRGRSAKRADLVDFSNRLEAVREFSKVSSPISNFLKEEDSEFLLTLDVAPSR
ncbi:MAG: hypothetical protein AAB846_00585 [Patescibacteria group bacterium]